MENLKNRFDVKLVNNGNKSRLIFTDTKILMHET